MKKGVDYIGVTCCFFCHDGQGSFLLNKRSAQCRDEIGRWDAGGGALEFGETFEEGVRREVKEEYCADAIEVRYLGARNVIRKNGDETTHWVSIIFTVQIDPGQVANGDPDKIDEIGWFRPENFPNPRHSMMMEHFELVKNAGVVEAVSV